MMVQDLSWRAAAVAVSLLLHFYVLFEWSDRQLLATQKTEQPPNSLFVQVNFPQPEPEAVMPVEEPSPEEPAPPPEPPPKPNPKPKPKPEPKPVPKSKPKPVQTPAKPKVSTEPPPQPAPMPPPSASRQLVDLRNEYLSRLLAKIEKNKFYPTIARKRNLQGMIQVRFRLGCEGEVVALEIDGGHSLLRKAAGKAIEAAKPLPKIPAEIECPMLVSYAMAYKLEN
ncbi:MAG: TonB family protein [Candidatus Thiodiazotropha sp.]